MKTHTADYRIERTRLLRLMALGQGGASIQTGHVPLEPRLPGLSCVADDPSVHSGASRANRQPRVFLHIRPSSRDEASDEHQQRLLQSLRFSGPTSFEVIGSRESVSFQWVCGAGDAELFSGQLARYYPHVEICPGADLLAAKTLSDGSLYRLRETYLLSVRTDAKIDPFSALLGSFEGLLQGEVGALQVLFVPVPGNWRSHIRALARSDFDPSKSRFANIPDLPKLADRKTALPLFAVSLRLLGSSTSVGQLQAFLTQFDGDNGFVPVPEALPSSSVIERTNQASGMILNVEELASLVHIPAPDVLQRSGVSIARPSAPPPDIATHDSLVTLGVNSYRGHHQPVGVTEEWLTRHCAVFGSTGSGKTTLLLRFIELVAKGYGVAFIDPKGDAAEAFLRMVPEARIEDTIYFNPADRSYSPAFNVLESSDDREKDMLCSDLMVAFRRYFGDAWGHRQERLLRQCVLTLLFSQGEKTLRELPRLLLDEHYRTEVLATIDDSELLDFWRLQFPRMGRDAVEPVLNKVSKFVDNRLVRYIIGQPNMLDFGRIVSDGKVFIANLSEGLLGEDTARLLGSFILSRFQQATMARQAIRQEDRKLFTLIVDEFQNFADQHSEAETIRRLFSLARGYRVALVVATQFLQQLHQDVLHSLLGNVGTLVAFRPGVADVNHLQKELGVFDASDLLNLGVFEALVRMGRASSAFDLRVAPMPVSQSSHADAIIEISRRSYCRPRDEVEALLHAARRVEGEPAPGAPRSTALDPLARLFLARAAESPHRTVTQLYADLSLSGYKGDQIKRALIAQGLVTEVGAPLGKNGRAAKFLIPTTLAYALLGTQRPRGKGGPLHKLLQQIVAEKGRQRGYSASLEEPVPGGQIDVSLVGPSQRIGVQIEVSRNHSQQRTNVQRCLANGFDRVIMVFVDPVEREAGRRRIEAELSEDERVRVGFCAPQDIGSDL